MCAMCDGETAGDLMAGILEDIDRVGWAIVAVEGQGARHLYTYTIGLTRYHGHPELLVSGSSFHTAHHVLDDLAALVRDGRRFEAGELLTRDELGHACLMVRVTSPSRLRLAQAVYGSDSTGPVPALQVVWADDDGKWPWELRAVPRDQEVYGRPLLRED